MADIIPIGTVTKLDSDVRLVLESAKDKLEGCVLIGFDKDGELYCASSYADGGTLLWLLEACKRRMYECI